MNQRSYEINKGIGRPIEFKGLKAQYIYYLAVGLAVLLVVFCSLYIAEVPVYVSVPVVFLAGGVLFWMVHRYSHKYGAFGLMKAMAYKRVPSAIMFLSFEIFRHLVNQGEKENSDDGGNGHNNTGTGGNTVTK